MAGKKKSAKKIQPKKTARKPKREWPPFGTEKSRGARIPTSVSSAPDPIPFKKVRYRNSSPRPTLVSVVLQRRRPLPPETVAVPREPGLVQPGQTVDRIPEPPTDDVGAVYGTVMYEESGVLHTHPFAGPWAPCVEWVEIETTIAWPQGEMYTTVTYHHPELI